MPTNDELALFPNAPPAMRSAEIGALTAALAKAQGQFAEVFRDRTADIKSERTGKNFAYTYATLGNVLAACRPALSAAGLALSQPLVRDDGYLVIRTTLYCGEQWLATDMPLTLPDGGYSAQAFGSAVTYARRYGIMALVGLAPGAKEDLGDEDADDDGAAAGRRPPQDERRPQYPALPEPAVFVAQAKAARDLDGIREAYKAAQVLPVALRQAPRVACHARAFELARTRDELDEAGEKVASEKFPASVAETLNALFAARGEELERLAPEAAPPGGRPALARVKTNGAAANGAAA